MAKKEIQELDEIANLLFVTLDSIQKGKIFEAYKRHETLKNAIISLKAPEYAKAALLCKAEETIKTYEKDKGIGSWPIQTKEKEEFDIDVYSLTHPRL